MKNELLNINHLFSSWLVWGMLLYRSHVDCLHSSPSVLARLKQGRPTLSAMDDTKTDGRQVKADGEQVRADGGYLGLLRPTSVLAASWIRPHWFIPPNCYFSHIFPNKTMIIIIRKLNIEKILTSYNDMVRKSKKYKQELKTIKAKGNINLIIKLRTLKTKDSRFYWKILQGTQKSLIPLFWSVNFVTILNG